MKNIIEFIRKLILILLLLLLNNNNSNFKSKLFPSLKIKILKIYKIQYLAINYLIDL